MNYSLSNDLKIFDLSVNRYLTVFKLFI